MVLSDTGFWYAFFNPKDRFHQQAVRVMEMLDEGLIITWPVITETYYLLGKALGVQSQLRFIKTLEADYYILFKTCCCRISNTKHETLRKHKTSQLS